MTAFVRPSLILRMDLDERLFNDETVAGIKRSYSYVAPSVVSSHEPADPNYAENNMRFMVKLHRAYWDCNDAEAQQLWENVMPKWLHNMFNKVSNTITAANKVCAEEGTQGMDYAWLELEFGENALVVLKTASDSSLPADGVETFERVRELMCAGKFGEDIACVRIPSRASWEAQLAAAEEAERAAEEAAAAEGGEGADVGEAAAEGAAAAEVRSANAQVDGASSREVPPAAALAEPAAGDVAEAADEEAEPVFVAPKLPAFEVDYGTWGIEYADGTVREFDAAAGAFK